MSSSIDSIKYLLTAKLMERIPQTIQGQGKNILICEVVRMLVDEGAELGFPLSPSTLYRLERHERKSRLTEALRKKYAQYSGDYASIKSIVTDFIDEASKIGIIIVPV